jgi:hypothetical protein
MLCVLTELIVDLLVSVSSLPSEDGRLWSGNGMLGNSTFIGISGIDDDLRLIDLELLETDL